MSALLDVALVVLLVVALVLGHRRGFIRSIGAIVGIAAGAVAAAIVAPVVTAAVDDGSGRVIATVAVWCALVLVGHAIGAGVGHLVGRRVLKSPIGVVDRILGAVVNGAVAALVASTIASAVVALGVPFLAGPIASSAVLRGIDAATPVPVSAGIAQLRSAALRSGLPRLTDAFGPGRGPKAPGAAASSPGLTRAARSVVKVTGTAYACGQAQSGSGFVIARQRVLTNAHVLSGVTEPVVLDGGGGPHVGRIVAYDPRNDLAVLAVPGLDLPAIPLRPTPEAGTRAVVDGFPFGGPYRTLGARVVAVGDLRVPDLDGGATVRNVATLAADVQQGNSGGPLLDTAGRAVGIVFAKSANADDVGYAMTTKQIAPLVGRAPALDRSVASGRCTRG